jgi:hypothetical protein
MEFMSRGRQAPPSPQQPTPASTGSVTNKKSSRTPKGMLRWTLTALLVIVVLLVLWLAIGKLRGSESSHVSSDQYQAVFLTNNQVYFGKITEINKQYLVLEDVFYIETPSSENQTSASNSNYTLRKLGANELHSPEDKMVINREQMTFWENLKDDGQVVTKINEYKANPDAANQQTTPTSPQLPSGTDSGSGASSETNP